MPKPVAQQVRGRPVGKDGEPSVVLDREVIPVLRQLRQEFNSLVVEPHIDAASSVDAPASGGVLGVNAAAGSVTVRLPPAADLERRLVVQKRDSTGNQVEVQASPGEFINGAGSVVLTTQYEVVELVADGSSYWVI